MNLKSLSFIILPAAFLLTFIVGLSSLSKLDGLSIIFVSAFALIIMQIIYLIDLSKNAQVKDKLLWALGLFFFFALVHPFYWYNYIYSPSKNL